MTAFYGKGSTFGSIDPVRILSTHLQCHSEPRRLSPFGNAGQDGVFCHKVAQKGRYTSDARGGPLFQPDCVMNSFSP